MESSRDRIEMKEIVSQYHGYADDDVIETEEFFIES
jgi:hypothetical protein